MIQRTTVAAITLVLLNSALPAQAALVTPTDATASSAFAIPPSATIDGSGLSGAGPVPSQTHDTNENNMWIAALGTQAQDEFLEFVLDQNYDLSSAIIWNYNGVDSTFGMDNSFRGIDEFEILVSPSLTGTYTSVGTFNLTQADPLFTPDLLPETINITANNVRRVMFDINSAHGGATIEAVGLSEVRFDGVALPPGPDRTWGADAIGDWSDGANWNPNFFPDDNTHTATFGSAISASRTVVTDTAVTAKSVTFDNTNSYVIAGAGSVNLEADSGDAAIGVVGGASAGSHQFQAVVNLGSDTNIDVGSGAEIVFNNALNLNGFTVAKSGAGALTINNQLNTGGGVLNVTAGTIQGGGTVGGDLNVAMAVVAPMGVLSVNGSYTQGPLNTTLAINVDGTVAGEGYDQLNVANTANLGGALAIILQSNYDDPSVRGQTDELALVLASMINGTFDVIDYDGTALADGANYVGSNQNGDDGLFRIVEYTGTAMTVTNYLAAAGDANGDRMVDDLDFDIWNANKFSSGAGWTDGDFNGDGLVNGRDFLIWNANKFTTVDTLAVPEPGVACWLLLLLVSHYGRLAGRRRFVAR